jgi:hypothetical protein
MDTTSLSKIDTTPLFFMINIFEEYNNQLRNKNYYNMCDFDYLMLYGTPVIKARVIEMVKDEIGKDREDGENIYTRGLKIFAISVEITDQILNEIFETREFQNIQTLLIVYYFLDAYSRDEAVPADKKQIVEYSLFRIGERIKKRMNDITTNIIGRN